MLSRWKIVSPLDFQQYNHFKYVICACMLVLEWKERAFIEKVNFGCFCWFPEAILVPTNTVHQYGVTIQSSTKVRETFGQITQKLWATKTWDLGKLFIYSSFITFIFLASSTGRFPIYIFFLRDSENDLYYYDQLAFSTKCISVTLDLQINSAVLLWDSIITLLISRWRGGTGQRKFSSTGGSRVVADARFVAPFLATRLTYPGSPRM